ncbi:MAG: xanthine dehydrogenase family protein subunit M [Thalassovita sp.]
MRYFKPDTFGDALAIAAQETGSVRYLAGGTDVLVQLRSDIFTPDALIDLKGIAGTKDILQKPDGGWEIGVAVSGAEISEHAALCQDWPGIVEAMDLIGSTQVQGRATLVGNLCNGSPAADSVPAMVAAGVYVTVQGPSGTRDIAVADIPTGPGKTVLAADEIITRLHIPARGSGGGDAYERFIPRTEMDIAVVGCGINLQVEGDKIVKAQVAVGAVAPTIRLVPEAEAALVGSTLDADALDALAAAVQKACDPINDKRGTIEFRIDVAGVLSRRVAETAYARARSAQ